MLDRPEEPPAAPPFLVTSAQAEVPPVLRSAPRARVWPSLLALVVGPFASAVVGGIAVASFVAITSPSSTRGDFAAGVQTWIDEHIGEPVAAAVILLPIQLAMLGVAVIFALASRENVFRRLGFVRGSATTRTVVLAVLGTLGLQFAITAIADQFIDDLSDSLRQIWKMMSEPTGVGAVAVGLMMSLVPGICEESLFRGYSQRGLLRRWTPFTAILVTSAAFALVHFDLQHSPAVFPLGVWFGFIAWRTGSVWPSVWCHFANNLFAFIVGRTWGDAETGDLEASVPYFVAGGIFLAFTVLATRALLRTRPPER